jgi:hypothetical protein
VRVAVHILLIGGGGLVVLAVVASTIKSTILPRGTSDRLSRVVGAAVRGGFRLVASRSDTYEARDRVMAMLGPVFLMALLVTWLGSIVGAYTMIFLGTATSSPLKALELSGSSITTLGTSATPRGAASLLTYTEAGLGLLVITLLITYLPSIYTSFSRRENGVGLLAVRAGTPPQATTMLVRLHRISETGDRMRELWQTWESWFTDVEETHSTFPILVFFRSPKGQQSWVTAAGVVLDCAALWVSAIDHDADPDAQLALRAGFLALRSIADIFHVAHDDDPAGDDPISVSRQEFDDALGELVTAGLSVRADHEAAWAAFCGWRVNYDTVLLQLARMVEAPFAPWISDRSPVSDRTRRALSRRPAPA